MVNSSPSAGVDVGARLRTLRTASSLSLRSLAEQSGLNFNTLSLIENGKTSPSVSTLQQLADALNIPIAAFFESDTPRQEIVHQQAGQRPAVSFSTGVLENLSEGFTRPGGRQMLVSLKPGTGLSPESVAHPGTEFVYCLEGGMEYEIDGKAFLLTSGDSLLFEARLPHRWGNPGKLPSRSLLMLWSSEERDTSAECHFQREPRSIEGALR